MYAIVKTGGKQYRVEKGETLLVERLAADEGATVTLEPLLIAGDKPVFGEAAAKAKVSAKVVAHERGHKRRTGHRQELTRIEITEISASASRSRAAAKPKAAEEASE